MPEYLSDMNHAHLIRREQNGLAFYQFRLLQTVPGLKHGIFTRLGGESSGKLGGLNISFSVGDRAERVAGNRKRVREMLGLPSLTSLRQVHGIDSVVISNGRVCDTTGCPETESGDILLTDQIGLGLMIKQADCQSVILYDLEHRALCNLHSGWRGNVRGVIGEGIRKMQAVYGTDPAWLLAAVGPSLGPCCAEFINYREELPEEAWKYQVRPLYFDLWQWSRDQLRSGGVREENIAVAGICTACHTEEFYSYRKEKVTGRFGTVVGLV
ncbi:MAG: laccase domain-containing protein [Deltaproteobacteria bacterium]|nr:laccase domain-containing protein [Deltaproteobacteria bacterium]